MTSSLVGEGFVDSQGYENIKVKSSDGRILRFWGPITEARDLWVTSTMVLIEDIADFEACAAQPLDYQHVDLVACQGCGTRFLVDPVRLPL